MLPAKTGICAIEVRLDRAEAASSLASTHDHDDVVKTKESRRNQPSATDQCLVRATLAMNGSCPDNDDLAVCSAPGIRNSYKCIETRSSDSVKMELGKTYSKTTVHEGDRKVRVPIWIHDNLAMDN